MDKFLWMACKHPLAAVESKNVAYERCICLIQARDIGSFHVTTQVCIKFTSSDTGSVHYPLLWSLSKSSSSSPSCVSWTWSYTSQPYWKVYLKALGNQCSAWLLLFRSHHSAALNSPAVYSMGSIIRAPNLTRMWFLIDYVFWEGVTVPFLYCVFVKQCIHTKGKIGLALMIKHVL